MSEATKTALSSKSGNANESADSAILNLAPIIGYHPLKTLYGSGVWSTSSQSTFYNNNNGDDDDNGKDSNESTSTANSAYGSTSLPLHTDMTYMTNPPVAHVFLMVQPATTPPASSAEESPSSVSSVPKGQSLYLDGFTAAQQLLLENPDANRLLATAQRTYRCIDDDEG